MDTPAVAVVGAGAVGCYYGALLAASGLQVTLIGRPIHVEALRAHGLRLSTAAGDRVVAVRADTDMAAAAGCDLVLVCVKSPDTEAVGAALQPHLSPRAAVYSLQNGVDNAQRLQALLGVPVRPAVVYVASEMAGAGHVRHLGRGELVLPGDAGDPGVAALSNADVARLLQAAGVAASLSDDVPGALWGKLALNCAYNALSAITRLPYGSLRAQPGLARVQHDAVAECLAVAHALGITPQGDVFEAVERIARTMPGQFSSTAQDLRRGRPSEIDHLNGVVVREGDRLGVPTPVNRVLLAMVRAIESVPAGW